MVCQTYIIVMFCTKALKAVMMRARILIEATHTQKIQKNVRKLFKPFPQSPVLIMRGKKMRSDYTLYFVAVICLIVAAYTAIISLITPLYIYAIVVLGIVFIGLGYMARPKGTTLTTTSSIPSSSPKLSPVPITHPKTEPKKAPIKKRARKKKATRKRKTKT